MEPEILDEETGRHRIVVASHHRELDVHCLDQSADSATTDWLITQAVLHANPVDETCERLVELLRERHDAVAGLVALVRCTPRDRTPLRATAVRLLGALEDPSAAEFLALIASEPLGDPGAAPPHRARTNELRIRRMAVEALLRIAERHASASESLLRVVETCPLRPILIEALKAASELGLNARVRQLLH
jgi:hypothetical protein